MSESAVCSNFLLLLILFRSPRGNILSKNNFVRFLCIVERNYVLSIRPLKRSSFRINTHTYIWIFLYVLYHYAEKWNFALKNK